jgi:hypothetical protein
MPRQPSRNDRVATETSEATSIWLDVEGLVAAGITPSRHAAYRAVRAGDLPEPTIVGGRFLWHSPSLTTFLLARAKSRREARISTRKALHHARQERKA